VGFMVDKGKIGQVSPNISSLPSHYHSTIISFHVSLYHSTIAPYSFFINNEAT